MRKKGKEDVVIAKKKKKESHCYQKEMTVRNRKINF